MGGFPTFGRRGHRPRYAPRHQQVTELLWGREDEAASNGIPMECVDKRGASRYAPRHQQVTENYSSSKAPV